MLESCLRRGDKKKQGTWYVKVHGDTQDKNDGCTEKWLSKGLLLSNELQPPPKKLFNFLSPFHLLKISHEHISLAHATRRDKAASTWRRRRQHSARATAHICNQRDRFAGCVRARSTFSCTAAANTRSAYRKQGDEDKSRHGEGGEGTQSQPHTPRLHVCAIKYGATTRPYRSHTLSQSGLFEKDPPPPLLWGINFSTWWPPHHPLTPQTLGTTFFFFAARRRWDEG